MGKFSNREDPRARRDSSQAAGRSVTVYDQSPQNRPPIYDTDNEKFASILFVRDQIRPALNPLVRPKK